MKKLKHYYSHPNTPQHHHKYIIYPLTLISIFILLTLTLTSPTSTLTPPFLRRASIFVEHKLHPLRPSHAPPPPRLAYLISGSKHDGKSLKRALLSLYHPNNVYVVHLDGEASVEDRMELGRFVKGNEIFGRFGNVEMIEKANLVTYRGPTMVANTLHAAAVLLRKWEWDWFINLSASDYPLVTQDDLLHTFSYLPRDLNFLDHTSKIGWKESQRAKPVIVDPGLYMSKKSDVFWITQRRSVPTAFKLFTVETPENHQLNVANMFWSQYPPDFLQKVVAEVVATFVLVFVSCGCAVLGAFDEPKVSQLENSIACSLTVMVMIYAVGHISGAHMNPAVTIAFAAVRHFPWKQVPFYAAAQFTGSIAASFAVKALLQPIDYLGTTTPSGTDSQALIMEIIVTFIMMFVTSAVATDCKAVGEFAGIAVGAAVCINCILAGPISGGSMNPARSIGPALASNTYKGIWVYIVGPITGTLSGVMCYSFIRAENEQDQEISSIRFRRMMSSDGHAIVKDPQSSFN